MSLRYSIFWVSSGHPHVDDVYDVLDGVVFDDGELRGEHFAVELVFDARDALLEVASDAVHLVDEDELGHAELVGLFPDSLALSLHAVDAIDDDDCSVEDAERAFDFEVEVDVSGRVDEVELVAFPVEGDAGRADGDASLAFFLHVVHDGVAVVHLSLIRAYLRAGRARLRRRACARWWSSCLRRCAR